MVLTAESAEPLKRCSKCGESKPLTEFHISRSRADGRQGRCKTCSAAGSKKRYEENRDKFTERRKRYHAEHAERQRENVRSYAAALKARVLAHYGTACACCGSADDLTLDHINGDGRQQREELFGDSKTAGVTMYRWVIANGFPEGFQTLCRVCNLNKSVGPRCTLSHLAEAEAQALVRKLVAEGHSITQIKKISGATLSQVREWRAQELERRSGGGYTEVC